MVLKQALMMSHEYAKAVVKEGDCVVDATTGNGNDTVFLAELVGCTGKVYGFDIQHEAIDNTRKKLEERGFLERCVLINDGHENMAKYITEPVKLVMFNLGYRPGGDHSIATKGETTMQAIRAALEKLVVHGLILVVIYHGGDSGFSERDYLLAKLPELNSKICAVMHMNYLNLPNNPPMLVCIEKLKQTD
ncbi:MAG: methyltransferase domain-containing protein [Clostridiaceae bacterium]|nr:methyltransferase domain-containing protein [Clostridiaceae bacterium]